MKINEVILEVGYDPSREKKLTKKEVDRNAFMASLKQYATWMGPNSKTWDTESYALAKKMHKQGYNPKEIWGLTQNIMGTDGYWRQEIDDSGSSIISNAKGNTMGDHIDHEELYLAYPELRNQPYDPNWDNTNTGSGGQVSYDNWDAVARDWTSKISIGNFDAYGQPVSKNSKLKTSNHEWGHVIQDKYEKFAKGDNWDSEVSIAVGKNNQISAMQAYLNKGGEHMTSASAARHNLTKKERGEIFPDLSVNALDTGANRVTVPGDQRNVPNFNTSIDQNLNPIVTTTSGKSGQPKKHVTYDNPAGKNGINYPDVTPTDIARIKQELKIKTGTKTPAPKTHTDVPGTFYGKDKDGNRYDGNTGPKPPAPKTHTDVPGTFYGKDKAGNRYDGN